MKLKFKNKGNLYVIIDPSKAKEKLLFDLESVLKEGVDLLQVWDNFSSENDDELILKMIDLSRKNSTPILINNRIDFLEKYDFDGIHFDEVPKDESVLKSELLKNKLIGITCNNDISLIEKTVDLGADYISFCSMFPSVTANSCELVDFETVKKAKEQFDIPIFLAGGIDLTKIAELKPLQANGIAVVSGIFSHEDPSKQVLKYKKQLQ